MHDQEKQLRKEYQRQLDVLPLAPYELNIKELTTMTIAATAVSLAAYGIRATINKKHNRESYGQS